MLWLFLPSPYLQALNFGVSGLGKSKRLNSGSVLFPFTLKLRFTASSTACGSDLQIHRPYSKDALSPVVTSLILLVYSSFFFFLLKCSCYERSLTGCVSQYPSKVGAVPLRDEDAEG